MIDPFGDRPENPPEPTPKPAAAKPLQKQQMVAMRSRARRLALQALYQWQISDHGTAELLNQFAADPAMKKADTEYFRELLTAVLKKAAEYQALITPLLDREWLQLDPIERSVLYIGAFELKDRPDLPFKVVINEGVKLAAEFGGTDSHNYINGVLDKLARELRPQELKMHTL